MPGKKPSQALREARKRIAELEAAMRPQPAPTPVVAEAAVVEPATTVAASVPAEAADPFADVPRDQAQAAETPPAPGAQVNELDADEAPSAGPGETTRLGEYGARAYLPLIFGAADTLSCAGASWMLRRKLGADGAKALEEQAYAIARLQDAEKAALEGALVQRLADIELTPDEMLLVTVATIYGSKALGVLALTTGTEASVPLPDAVH